MVVFCGWSGICDRAGRTFCSRRLAKGARLRQADTLRAALLRGTTRGIRHRTFHIGRGRRVDRAGMDSVASVLDLLRRRLLYSSGVEHRDQDSGAPFGEFAGPDVFPFCGADGRSRLDRKPARPDCVDAGTAGINFRRRRSRPGSKSQRAEGRARHRYPCHNCAILRCNHLAVLQLRAIHAWRSRGRPFRWNV